MNRNTWYRTSSRFAFAAGLAAGMAGAPLAFDDSGLSLSGAAAQAAAPDVNADDEDGEAEEFVESPESRVRGTGSIGVSRGEEGALTDPALVNTSDPDLQNYIVAAERGDLEEAATALADAVDRSEEHTSELQSLMRISYAVFCLKKKKQHNTITKQHHHRQDYNSRE